MKFSAQAMVNGWIDASLGRHTRVTGSAGAATIDAVRGDTRAPRVTIVNWRWRDARVGQLTAQHEPARTTARDTIGHDLARPARRHVPAGGHDIGPARQGAAAL